MFERGKSRHPWQENRRDIPQAEDGALYTRATQEKHPVFPRAG
jgi:hypothetical protein